MPRSTSGRRTIGCIGFGNMGRALALGVRNHPELGPAYDLIAYDTHAPSLDAARAAGIEAVSDPLVLAGRSDIVLLAVKPYQAEEALRGIAPALGTDTLLLSIAAGVRLDALAAAGGGQCPVIRVMPNTPALVGEGVFGLCFGPTVDDASRALVRGLFAALGRVAELPESKMNAFTALSGSGPGYVFHFMESLAEAGVSAGLDRQSSRDIALALLKGCAVMAEQTGTHPAVLREQVSSPGGTTVAGLNHLDRHGARGLVVDAVLAALARAEAMDKE